ncbi:MAG: class I SAM-dependent methyltransferase [candidate division KSB1 bacterium]|nr:class I SAM-dependent methyltransferase [candidate division KSB1 bacterium]
MERLEYNIKAYDKLYRNESGYFPGFHDKQMSGIKEIYEKVFQKNLIFESIDTIVDVGCGKGELLIYLFEKHQQKNYIGIDPSQEAIDSAKKKIKSINSNGKILFLNLAAEGIFSNPEFSSAIIGTSLLISMGHSIPHFEEKWLAEYVDKFKPKYVYIDFYHNFGEIIDQLNNDEKIKIEPKNFENEEITALFTEMKNTGIINRGILINKGGSETRIIETQQNFKKPEYYKEVISKKDYLSIVTDEIYYLGYGPMKGFLFCYESDIGRIINDKYYEFIYGQIISKIMEKDYIKALFEVTKMKCEAVILPFDKRLTFAKYFSIDASKDDIPNEQMLVDSIYNTQEKYPTAHGLFMTFLDKVSVSNIIPLTEWKEKLINKVDKCFGDNIEKPFFKKCSKGNKLDKEIPFFIIPFYFGQLPLFGLVLQVDNVLNKEFLSEAVFYAFFNDVYNLINIEIGKLFRDNEIVGNFVLSSINALANAEGTKNRDDAISDFKRHFAYAREKPWKSWIITLPTVEIKKVKRINAENDEFIQLVESWLERGKMDEYDIVSEFFKRLDFFSGGNHDECCKAHCDILANAGNLESNVLLNTIVNTNVFKWLKNKVNFIINNKNTSLSTNKECQECFQLLKSVFCKCQENKGNDFRFRLLRLKGVLEIKLMDKQTSIKYDYFPDVTRKDESWWTGGCKLKDPFIQLANDKTDKIIDLLENGFKNDSIKNITLGKNKDEYFLKIKLVKIFNNTAMGRGQDYNNVKKCLKILDSNYKDQAFQELTIKFEINDDGKMSDYFILAYRKEQEY